ncbi:MAG: hypothetical protein M3375_09620 [Actinomycetota bacterium]|nr:hypothetical protein [Actinomycetota bacterium]
MGAGAVEGEAARLDGPRRQLVHLQADLVEAVQVGEHLVAAPRNEAKSAAPHFEALAFAGEQPHGGEGAERHLRRAALLGQPPGHPLLEVGGQQQLGQDQQREHAHDEAGGESAHTILHSRGEVAEWLKALAC